ncbi:hypothetical protein HDV05_006208 [Chytridiales sp. JEL 0842]|nr:hypothetical protein HDV05_006208 [Chytridiales sp. JEL 0842]
MMAANADVTGPDDRRPQTPNVPADDAPSVPDQPSQEDLIPDLSASDDSGQQIGGDTSAEITTEQSPTFPPVTASDVRNCALPAWYDKFRKITLKSIIIPLPEDFVDYLNADGVFLPLDSNGQPQPNMEYLRDSDSDSNSSSMDDDDDDHDEESPSWSKIPHFPELQQRIQDAIEELGGTVFPKLNWSSPKDASWMSLDGTLKCKSISDILLLLKSSDFIAHDLSHAFEICGDAPVSEETIPTRPDTFVLVLRKWYDLNPSMEFRCFVKDNRIIGISQRDFVNHYPFLVQSRAEIESRINAFFEGEIRTKFPNSSYAFDVYVNRNNEKVWLVDFSPFGSSTDSLLFSWNELLSATSPTLRIVSEPSGAYSGLQPMFATNRLPKEVIDLSNGNSIDEFAEKFMSQLMLSQQRDDSDDEA